MSSARLPVLEKFIADLRTVWSAEADNQRRMERAKPLLEQLVKDAGLKAHSASWPSTKGYKNLLLYVYPDHHFAINAVVRAPGRTGSVHDHADAWVLYGVLDGSESLERYERVDDGSRPAYAEVRLATCSNAAQGKGDLGYGILAVQRWKSLQVDRAKIRGRRTGAAYAASSEMRLK